MNVKQLFIAVFSLIILGGVSVMLLDNDWSGEGSGIGEKVLKNLPVNDMAKITISGKENSTTLEKKDGVWTVKDKDGYAADFQKISSAVLKLRDLKVDKVIKAKSTAYGRLQLDSADKSNPPTVISCFDKSDGKVAELSLGKEYERKGASQPRSPYGNPSDGRYVLAKGATKPVLVSESFSEFDADAFSWVDRSFVRISKVKSITRKEGDKTLWKIATDKENGTYSLSEVPVGREADTEAVKSLSTVFNYMYFEDVKKEVSEKPYTTVIIDTFDGFNYIVKFYKVNVDTYATVAVSAKFAEKREPVKDEKPEDTAKLDREFTDNLKTLKEKLATEQKLAGWFYKYSAGKVENMLKSMDDLTKAKEKKKEEPKQETVPVGPVK